MLEKKSKEAALLLILFGSFLIVFYPVITGLIKVWGSSDEYSHGFLIFPISLYIIWNKKEKLRTLPVNGGVSGIYLVIFSLLLYAISAYAEIKTIAPIAMILFIFGLVIYLFGYRVIKELLFPLTFLFFMVPVPSQIYSALTIPLQLFVSEISVNLSVLLQIPIYREGNVIFMADRTLQVVQACSGLRSMISLLTLSAVFGYFTLSSNIYRTILFATGIPVAVFVNIIRVLIMITAFHFFNYDLTEGSVHTIFGLVIFGFALISIVIIKKVLLIWDKSAAIE